MVITIGIPTFNRSDKLLQLLNNLKDQDFQDFKVLVSDNCSKDNTEEICKTFSNRFKNFDYQKQVKTINVLDNYKFLFDKCDTKYFMWLPDDDQIDKDYIKTCLEYIIKNDDYVLVSGGCNYYLNNKFAFKGNEINIENTNLNKRVYSHYSKARDNGNFYGIYNKEKILSYIYPKKYCGDLIFLANVSMFGKIKCINSTFIHRDLGGGTSGSLEGIIKNLGLSKWHLYFFHYISTYDIFKNSIHVQEEFKNKLKFDFFFNFICSFTYLKKNLKESIYHILKILIRKNQK